MSEWNYSNKLQPSVIIANQQLTNFRHRKLGASILCESDNAASASFKQNRWWDEKHILEILLQIAGDQNHLEAFWQSLCLIIASVNIIKQKKTKQKKKPTNIKEVKCC